MRKIVNAFIALILAIITGTSPLFATELKGRTDASEQGAAEITASVHGMRVQQNRERLAVTEILVLENASTPPHTVRGHNLFWLAFPKQAILLSSKAEGPGGQALESGASPVPVEGRCYFSLPLQPGNTKLQLQYEVPFSGRFTFSPHIPFVTESFGVVRTASLDFQSSEPGVYADDSDQYEELAEVVKNVAPGELPPFAIVSSPTADAVASSSTTMNTGVGLVGLIAAGSIVGIWLLLARARKRKSKPAVRERMPARRSDVRDELFSLELARVGNRISYQRYLSSKKLLEKRISDLS